MVTGLRWAVVNQEQAAQDWDGWLTAFEDRHIRQSYAWGRHKQGRWQPLYTALFNGPTPVAMALVLTRRLGLGALNLSWINGGPSYRKARPQAQNLAALAGYIDGLKEHLETVSRLILRLNLEIPMDVETQLILRRSEFTRPISSLGTGLTYIMDLKPGLEQLRANLERNWRHQLNQAEKIKPEITVGRGRSLLERYLPLHNALCERKGLAAGRLDLGDLEAMVAALGEKIFFIVISAEGRDGCGGAVWTYAGKAWMALSAANETGLKLNFPNAMYWHIIALLKNQGVSTLDLTGIDPARGWGVFNFKRGLNAPAVEMIGEWERSSSAVLRRAFNLALHFYRGRLP